MNNQYLNIKNQHFKWSVLVNCYLVFLLVGLFSPFFLFAQKNPQPYFRNYGTADGLPSPEVYVAMQDSKGYMWFGTDNGAVRFDGYGFETFDAQDGLMSNVVFDIFEDKKGRMWFGTMTGEVYIMEQDTILPYQYNHLVKGFEGQFTGAGLERLEEDEKAYIVLNEYGLISIDKNGNVDTIRGTWVSSILVIDYDSFGKTIVLGGQRADFDDFVEKRNKWRDFQKNDKVLAIEIVSKTKRIKKLLPMPVVWGKGKASRRLANGALLIQAGSALHCLQDAKIIWSIPFDLDITEIILEEDGSIWFCLNTGMGIRKYSNLEALKQGKYVQFLNGKSITNLYKDKNDGYWVTSKDNGVFYSPDINILCYDTSFGFDDDYITALGFKNETTLFVGTKSKSIYQLNTVKQNYKIIGKTDKTNPSKSFYYDASQQKLWVGGYYLKNNKKTFIKRWDSLYEKYILYSPSSFENLHTNSKGYLLGNLGFGGIHIFDLKTEKFKFCFEEHKRKRIYGLYSDKKDNLWMGTDKGLFQFEDSTIVHCGIQHPAFQNRVEDIDGFLDGSLVFGTKGYGVIKWKGDEIWQATTKGGLSSNMLEDVHVDDKGVLWVSTLNGLNKITFDSSGVEKIRQFKMINGLPSDEIYQVKSYEGQIWLCTNKGLVKFHEREENIFSLRPVIEEVEVNSMICSIGKQFFNYDENNLKVSYLTINYRLNGETPYRYRIKKADEWQYTQNRSVNFSGLRPNNYTFQVQSQNEDGYWSESAGYDFSIHPPWWATWWFRLLGVAGVVSIGYGFYRNRIKELQEKSELQEQFISLEKSALQAQMNPHFIFNCLNSIQNFILQNDRKKAVEYLSRFAGLVRHNLDASIQGEVSLEDEAAMLDNYLALEQERFNRSFDYEISVSAVLEDDFVEFPSMLIQPFVENAVIHGMGGKEDNGQIKVCFTKKDDILQVVISDNGSGYRQNEGKNKVSRHKSAGMSITQKRLELLGTDTKNVIDIQTKKNEKGEIAGTEVKVFIKIKEST